MNSNSQCLEDLPQERSRKASDVRRQRNVLSESNELELPLGCDAISLSDYIQRTSLNQEEEHDNIDENFEYHNPDLSHRRGVTEKDRGRYPYHQASIKSNLSTKTHSGTGLTSYFKRKNDKRARDPKNSLGVELSSLDKTMADIHTSFTRLTPMTGPSYPHPLSRQGSDLSNVKNVFRHRKRSSSRKSRSASRGSRCESHRSGNSGGSDKSIHSKEFRDKSPSMSISNSPHKVHSPFSVFSNEKMAMSPEFDGLGNMLDSQMSSPINLHGTHEPLLIDSYSAQSINNNRPVIIRVTDPYRTESYRESIDSELNKSRVQSAIFSQLHGEESGTHITSLPRNCTSLFAEPQPNSSYLTGSTKLKKAKSNSLSGSQNDEQGDDIGALPYSDYMTSHLGNKQQAQRSTGIRQITQPQQTQPQNATLKFNPNPEYREISPNYNNQKRNKKHINNKNEINSFNQFSVIYFMTVLAIIFTSVIGLLCFLISEPETQEDFKLTEKLEDIKLKRKQCLEKNAHLDKILSQADKNCINGTITCPGGYFAEMFCFESQCFKPTPENAEAEEYEKINRLNFQSRSCPVPIFVSGFNTITNETYQEERKLKRYCHQHGWFDKINEDMRITAHAYSMECFKNIESKFDVSTNWKKDVDENLPICEEKEDYDDDNQYDYQPLQYNNGTNYTDFDYHDYGFYETYYDFNIQGSSIENFKNATKKTCVPKSEYERNKNNNFQDLHNNFKKHYQLLHTLQTIFRIISIIGCFLALVTYLMLPRLLSTRTIIHINMMLAYILKNISVLAEHSLVNRTHSTHRWIDGVQHKQGPNFYGCRFVVVFYQYASLSCLLWILIETMYLHSLIFIVFFEEKTKLSKLLLLGWGLPLLPISIWSLLRLNFNNEFCWVEFQDKMGDMKLVYELPHHVGLIICLLLCVHILFAIWKKIRYFAGGLKDLIFNFETEISKQAIIRLLTY